MRRFGGATNLSFGLGLGNIIGLPLLVDRNQEAIRLNFWFLVLDDDYLDDMGIWVRFVKIALGHNALNNFKTLEIRSRSNRNWFSGNMDPLHFELATREVFWFIRNFPRLEKVVITNDIMYRGDIGHPQSKEVVESALKKAIDEGYILSGKVPEVIVRKWMSFEAPL